MTYKILAVDDHPETLDIIMTTLEANGYQVIGSRSPIRGLAMAESEMPDLILLDMNMPDMDGKEVARRLRVHPDLADIPIIMFTAEGEVAQKQESFDIGVDDYLTKPTDPGEMIDRIEALMENRVPRSKSPTGKVAATIVMDDLDEEQASPATSGSNRKLVVIVGARGGAGTTTVAINLAAILARMKQPTTLVDLDLAQGHIGLYLKQEMGAAEGFAGLLGTQASDWPMLITAQMKRYNEYLQMLLADFNLDGRKTAITIEQTEALAAALNRLDQFILIDAGCGLNQASLEFMKRADQVLVCFRPERVSLSVTRRFLKQLEEMLPAKTKVSPVLFDTQENIMLPQNAVEGFLGHQIMAAIAIKPQEMNQTTNKGNAYVNLFPKTKISKLFAQMAQQLMKTGI